MRTALTIAGSDSGGGAGIQADLKTFAALGVHGTSVITALTAQNTMGVRGVHNVPPEFILAQLDAIHADLEVAAAKTGMLSTREIISAVANGLGDYPLVVDPVMVAESGARLLDEDAIEALTGLFPRAALITPNLAETEVLTGMGVKTVHDMKEAARDLAGHGCSVLIKGGHMNATDVLYHQGEYHLYEGRLLGGGAHGSGCTMASAICAGLATGHPLPYAVARAKDFITAAIKNAYSPGRGGPVANQLGQALSLSEKFKVQEELLKVLLEVEGGDFGVLVPEVGTNMVYAVPGAKGPEDVAGISGRIVKINGAAKGVGRIQFGVSKHVASIVLTAMAHDPAIRSCINIRFEEGLIKTCMDLGFSVTSFKRQDEPREVSTMEWGTDHAIRTLGKVPDIIYDKGDIGKEAMIRVLGHDPGSVWGKVKRILASL